MTFARAQAIADAVLYEGYVLDPYRASARKHRMRWRFGVAAPAAWSRAGGCEGWRLECQTLIEAGRGGRIEGCLRFLTPRARQIEERRIGTESGYAPVTALEVAGTLHTSWETGVLREIPFALDAVGTREKTFAFEAERTVAELVEDDGWVGGRTSEGAAGANGVLRVSLEPVAAVRPLLRLAIAIENHTPFADLAAPRERALAAGFVGVHALVAAEGGSFVSLAEPPDFAAAAAAACRNVGLWPVLAGPEGDRSLLLASPIPLSDHPAVAPESPGLFGDATEIDEILTLRGGALTEAEKREARATDPHAAAPALDREAFFGSSEPGGDATLEVAGRTLRRGSRVRLQPSRRADTQDAFLADRIARVEGVYRDVDGGTHVGVTLEGDPGAELHVWHGRYFFVAPEELVPMEEGT